MSRPAKTYASSLIDFLLLLLFKTCNAAGDKNNSCVPSSCGNIPFISYPFRLNTDPLNCGHPDYTLYCHNNLTVLYLYSGKYYVQEINYNNFTIRLVDEGVQKDNCSSMPLGSLISSNFSNKDPYTMWTRYKVKGRKHKWKLSSEIMMLIKCASPVNSPLYVDTAPCNINGVGNSSTTHYYVNVGRIRASELMESCNIETMMLLPKKDYRHMPFSQIHSELAYGFELSWINLHCEYCTPYCYLDHYSNHIWCGTIFYGFAEFIMDVGFLLLYLVLLHAPKVLCGTPCVIALLTYKWRRRHLSAYDRVEEFLQSNNNFMPVRYSYSDIKKMTRSFRDKLGEGGFGQVYKGKLRSGRFAAVKMLGKSKANGQEFISEVATIGRIHHVNIVQLIGFCAEGSKRALVYDFMPNGSLNNHIFSGETTTSLSWQKLFEISLGVARAIEYLHRGCDMQILHFDIKPHNILLDENFTPKVSDFGLARLYATNNTIASLTAARGTIGYMAPELLYKNIGRVSHKADVYSFGMLLLEMAGQRKNLNALAEKSSQIYFPSWVYDQISGGKTIEIGDATEEVDQVVKKMIIVGLWCIQMKPDDRPPMNKVLEMLEGDLESLQLPPKPALCPEETLRKDEGESSYMLDDSSESVTLNNENAC